MPAWGGTKPVALNREAGGVILILESIYWTKMTISSWNRKIHLIGLHTSVLHSLIVFNPTVPYSLSFASWLSTHQSLQRKDVACSVSFKPQLWCLADICWPLLHSNAIEKEVAYRANEHEIMPARCPVHKKIILLLQDGFILWYETGRWWLYKTRLLSVGQSSVFCSIWCLTFEVYA